MRKGNLHTEVPHPKAFFRKKKSGPEILAGINRTLTLKRVKNNNILQETTPKQAVASGAGIWTIDKGNSSLEFSVMHLKLANIGGRFNDFDVKVNSVAEDFTGAIIELNARVNSLDTGNVQRDNALKGEEWLKAQKFPIISFNSTSFKKTEGNKYELTGNLTINGVSHTLTFDAVLNGMFTNTFPKKTICGFTIVGLLSRNKFQLGNVQGATGVSDEITVGANIELVKEG